MAYIPIFIALTAAALFGLSTPASKSLLNHIEPFQLAGLLYLGGGLGVLPILIKSKKFYSSRLFERKTFLRLIGAIASGGIIAPVLLLFGLEIASASSVALWLNLELIATVLLGYFFFKDNLSKNSIITCIGITTAAILLSISSGIAGIQAGLLIAISCFFWGIDNHLSALIDGITPSQTMFWKGMVAGIVNLTIGLMIAPVSLSLTTAGIALLVGVFCYGISIVLHIISSQKIGASRTQIIFSTSPFFAILLSYILLGENITAIQIVSGIIIAASLVFLFLENHNHKHTHRQTAHEHWHRHNDGHHLHPELTSNSKFHSHYHEHGELTHSHTHLPDLSHRHTHKKTS